MTDAAKRPPRIDPDLVEYVVVTAPDAERLADVAQAIADAAKLGAIQILDLVVIVTEPGTGAMQVVEIEDVEPISKLTELHRPFGPMLSEHDIELVGVALEPAEAAMLVLVETRWAEPLSLAARQVGGRVVGGERIPHSRVAAALGQREPDDASPDQG